MLSKSSINFSSLINLISKIPIKLANLRNMPFTRKREKDGTYAKELPKEKKKNNVMRLTEEEIEIIKKYRKEINE